MPFGGGLEHLWWSSPVWQAFWDGLGIGEKEMGEGY